jgi:DNA invertase Pin-like site-specific DNA recombinase
LGRNWVEIHRFVLLCLDQETEIHAIEDELDSTDKDFFKELGHIAWAAQKEGDRRSRRVKAKLSYLKENFSYKMHGSPPGGYLSRKTLAKLPAILAFLRDRWKPAKIAAETGVDVRTIAKAQPCRRRMVPATRRFWRTATSTQTHRKIVR